MQAFITRDRVEREHCLTRIKQFGKESSPTVTEGPEGIKQPKILTRVTAVYNHLLFGFIREGRRHFRHSL